MKKWFILPMIFLLIGVGCNPEPQEAAVGTSNENTWFLTFENGDSWFPVEMYLNGEKFGDVPKRSTRPRENRAFVQNVYKPVLLDTMTGSPDIEYSNDTDWILVDVSVYPEQANMPDNLLLEQIGDRTIGVREREGANLYYWKTDNYLYEMYLYTANGNDEGWEELFGTIAEIELDNEV